MNYDISPQIAVRPDFTAQMRQIEPTHVIVNILPESLPPMPSDVQIAPAVGTKNAVIAYLCGGLKKR